MKEKRSSKYDVFKSNYNQLENKTPKHRWKIVWKITRIFIYLFLAAISLTGCIQSFIIKTSTTTGSGIEFYNNEDEIAPYVNLYKIEEYEEEVNKIDKNGNVVLDQNGNPIKIKVKKQRLVPKSTSNFLITETQIKDLKTSINTQYTDLASLYGAEENYSSTLRIVDSKDNEVDTDNINTSSNLNKQLVSGTKKPNDFLFMNSLILEKLNETNQVYQPINNWNDIPFFVLKKPWNNLNEFYEYPLSIRNSFQNGITDLNYAFEPWEVIDANGNPLPSPIKIKSLNGIYYTQDANWDGIKDTNNWIQITNYDRLSKMKYSFVAEKVNFSSNGNNLNSPSTPYNNLKWFNSQLYARDFLQSLLNVEIQFSNYNDFFNEIILNQQFLPQPQQPQQQPSTASERFKELEQFDFNKIITSKYYNENDPSSTVVDSTKLLSFKQKESIIQYQRGILNIATASGWGVKRQIYPSDGKDDPNVLSAYESTYLPDINDKVNILIGSSPAPQVPVTSWAESWKYGPFYGLFVWPISYLTNGIVGSMPVMEGWAAVIALVVVVITTRAIATLITYKSIFATAKQQALAPKKAKIDAKYEGFKGNKQMEQRKRVEINELYKKNNISMFAPMLSILITTPIFLAVWRAIQGVPDIKSASWLGIQFSLTSWKELFSGQIQYLPLLLITIVVQLASSLLPRYLTKKRMNERISVAEKAAAKKANRSQNIMMFVFLFMGVMFDAGLQIYWIVGGIWQIIQTLSIHYILKTNFYKEKLSKWV